MKNTYARLLAKAISALEDEFQRCKTIYESVIILRELVKLLNKETDEDSIMEPINFQGED